MSSPQQADELAGQGLYSERTHLAWQRTGLAFAGVGALLVHAAGGFTHPLSILPGVFGLAVSAVIFGRGVVRSRAAAAATGGRLPLTTPVGLLAVALAATVLSVSGLVEILLAA